MSILVVGVNHRSGPLDLLERLVLPGRLVGPREALTAGMADEVAPLGEVRARALAHASALAELDRGVYAANKGRLRGAAAAAALAELERRPPALRPSP